MKHVLPSLVNKQIQIKIIWLYFLMLEWKYFYQLKMLSVDEAMGTLRHKWEHKMGQAF